MTTVTVTNNEAESRYQTTVDGQLSLIDYRLYGETITFTHTEVPPALEGQGIASQMAKFALDEARAKGYRVRPLCPFVKGYIKQHEEYQDLVK